MKIHVWHDNETVKVLDVSAPGPDLHVDPWAGLVQAREKLTTGGSRASRPTLYYNRNQDVLEDSGDGNA